MGRAWSGPAHGPEGPEGPGEAGGLAPGHKEWRDWAGLPEDLLMKVAGKLVAQNEAGWAARFRKRARGIWSEERIQQEMARRKREGNCLFVFALVCKPWRKAQLKFGGPLRTRVHSDVILPGSVALVKWALAEGCPREGSGYTMGWYTMAKAAARYGHLELVRWLIQEQGFAMDWMVMQSAVCSGNLALVKWLRGKGCPRSYNTWFDEVLRIVYHVSGGYVNL